MTTLDDRHQTHNLPVFIPITRYESVQYPAMSSPHHYQGALLRFVKPFRDIYLLPIRYGDSAMLRETSPLRALYVL